MRFEIEVKELDPYLLLVGWQGWPDCTCMYRAAFEFQCDADGRQSKHTSFCTEDQLFEHDVHNEEKRIEQFDWRVQLHVLFESERRFYGLKQMWHLPACQLTKALACLSHSGDQFFLGQSCQHSQSSDTPKAKGICLFFGHIEDRERERCECCGFFTHRDNPHRRSRRQSLGECNRRMEVMADSNASRDAK